MSTEDTYISSIHEPFTKVPQTAPQIRNHNLTTLKPNTKYQIRSQLGKVSCAT